ncbi:MBL fold metallo-hydrolase [Pseudoalteromonas luteoviolacea]|uniref:Metallo-beta-lactamase domain-containing protein n=1 Tax=Pseudoalteromonas luteoviolacea S4054 TaxID=1129367 RepID=A0A0F6AC64_9GAMM|nr:MBL fold metallo-hydrolase [Pseudoalteromonas luteoviolacea]AOT08595.1 MBL fold metallo-hydrolase [Pseudoalteromonas luteoviolacea]AOT13511.1 MBL fold metallo-hydrolase [Pseudoalteromonas luteoviolacea]AOT18424.1 MBL fold metallo-hydrolase [Pseudoalteromonas luteoviolacea]KKE83406.1 hypothetical protein N479_13630 [Pseudoalteromonas luteoviolacea S4054]KZN75843.1 hypothetical protein N481_05725 [Pseudoalteromonas luteoviolacea S4047-1]
MQLKFYGVRGSIPTPGPDTVKYGGNTVCVSLQSQNNTHIILDSGTGIRILGDELIRDTRDIYILLSHNHWDHIQGFPFFVPAYMPNRTIAIVPGVTDCQAPDAILRQMDGSYFPVQYDDLPSAVRVLPQQSDKWHYHDIYIERMAMNHPGGGSAYRLTVDGVKIVYAIDNELYPPNDPVTSFDEWVEFVDGVDYLIHDGQFIPSDYPLKMGWGHSQIKDALALAVQGKVKNLVIISHDPARTDKDLDQIALDIGQKGFDFNTIIAHEGLVIK